MARIRSIKPQFFDNYELAQLPPLTRLLFIGLWNQADRRGRLKDRPMQLKKNILGWDDINVDACLNDLADYGFIVRYEVGDEGYIEIVNFEKHQKPHPNETETELPHLSEGYVLRSRKGRPRDNQSQKDSGGLLSSVLCPLSSVSLSSERPVTSLTLGREEEGPKEPELPGQIEVSFADELETELDFMSDEELKARLRNLESAGDAAAKETREQIQKNIKKREAKGYKPRKPREKVHGAPVNLEKLWHHEMAAKFPDHKEGVWGGQEVGQTANLVRKYDEELVGLTFKYVIRNWDRVREKVFKGNALLPNLNMITKLHQSLFGEAQQWEKVRTLLEEKQKFLAANPNSWKLPSDLAAKLDEAASVLKALGLE